LTKDTKMNLFRGQPWVSNLGVNNYKSNFLSLTGVTILIIISKKEIVW